MLTRGDGVTARHVSQNYARCAPRHGNDPRPLGSEPSILPLYEQGTMGTPIPTEWDIYDVLTFTIIDRVSQTYGIRTRAYYLDRVAL